MGTRPDDGHSSWNAWVEPNILAGRPKEAASVAGGDLQTIPVDAFNRVILEDPFLTPQLRAATVGLVSSADAAKGGPGIINPFDLTRIAVGMGAGLSQAYLGGRVLGALAGLTPEAQAKFQQVGLFAGAIKSVVPGMFGGR
jgi:hypothetical protein